MDRWMDEVLVNLSALVCVCVCVPHLADNLLWNFIRHRGRYETWQHTVTPDPKPGGKEKDVIGESSLVLLRTLQTESAVCRDVLLASPAELFCRRPG